MKHSLERPASLPTPHARMSFLTTASRPATPSPCKASTQFPIALIEPLAGIASLAGIFRAAGHPTRRFESIADFLRAPPPAQGCIIFGTITCLGESTAIMARLEAGGLHLPVIMLASRPTLALAVDAFRAGIADFVDRDATAEDILSRIAVVARKSAKSPQQAHNRMESLTARQKQILDLVVEGHPSKNIATDLGVSQRTVENHRASINRKMGSRSLPRLIHAAVCSACLLRVRPQDDDVRLA